MTFMPLPTIEIRESRTENRFFLVIEFASPVAALLPARLTAAQYKTLFAILPRAACNCPALAARWEYSAVIAAPDWARVQLRRVPMLPPKNLSALSFL